MIRVTRLVVASPQSIFGSSRGQSGNPRGRPRGSVDFRRALIDAANKTVVITENDRKVRVTKLEVAARQLVNQAASGDRRSIEQLLKHIGLEAAAELATASPADPPELSSGSEDDEQVLAAFLRRAKETGS